MGEVDPAFVQSAEHRPNLSTPPEAEEESVPLISLSSPADRLVSEIREACRKWGFFQLVDHGVPAELVERIRRAAKEFFEEAGDEKWKVKRGVRDWKEVFDFLLHSPTLLSASPLPHDHQLRILNNQWPSFPPYFSTTLKDEKRKRRGTRVKRKSDGQWIPVHPVANAVIINVGDAVQVWSNDGYESVEQRVVVNREKERVSVPFFFFPGHWVMVKPLEELVKEGEVGNCKEYNWGKFFVARNRSDYKKLEVDNIQVSQFRNQ